jgi:hypothetical protein
LYRLLAVLELFAADVVTVEATHQHVQQLQLTFLEQLDGLKHAWLNRQHLIVENLAEHGHFLTFRGPDAAAVAQLSAFLKQHHIDTDYRGDRLRFGFALYHDAADINLTCLAAQA